MTDISKAIGELREAVEQDFSFGLMNPRFCAVEIELEKIYGVNHPMQVIARMDAALCRGIYDKNGVLAALDRLASAVDGGTVEPIGYALWCKVDESIWECVLSNREDADFRCEEISKTTGYTFDILPVYTHRSPTPSLTERIEAAAEDIADSVALGISPKRGANIREFTAILRRHIEGGK